MDGAGIFNFTIKRVPALVADTLALAGKAVLDVDQYVFHQSNRFIMKHLAKKCGLPEDRVPMTIEDSANCGGPSVAVTLTAPRPLASVQASFFDVPQGRRGLLALGVAEARRRGAGTVGYFQPVDPACARPGWRYELIEGPVPADDRPAAT